MDQKKDVRDLRINAENPRVMSEFMEGKLIESLLVFPKMLETRPIILSDDDVVMGGNQRVSVLCKILAMDDNTIEDYMFNQKKFRLSSNDEKMALMEYWKSWKENPTVPVRVIKDMTAEELKEFLVKDNLHYGEDDMEAMKKYFDRETIGDITGSVAWNMYDYDDRMNDEKLDTKKKYPERFKCGYVEVQMTDEEFKLLCEKYEEYLSKNEGIGDGFLTYLLIGK